MDGGGIKDGGADGCVREGGDGVADDAIALTRGVGSLSRNSGTEGPQQGNGGASPSPFPLPNTLKTPVPRSAGCSKCICCTHNWRRLVTTPIELFPPPLSQLEGRMTALGVRQRPSYRGNSSVNKMRLHEVT
ncbi:hypothetical protein EMWEY_00035960 [Eimeria maxima]|uniref:Uncharacterized protein n=1 Tax=Eimeria maxima TaxID=5804 RepID=U6MA26_EIMMA|nr:hypothetical protein EMWEY_00035960 [Eimeria maxima]CDJ60896.1 hypothetical protein EMWEY_00035960 [Eimeria maxima]